MVGYSYKNLIVWQKSKELTIKIYELTNQLPPEERFGLSSQLRRASISIVSNIAEGSRKRTHKDKNNFLTIAFGSASELEAQIDVIKSLPFGQNLKYERIDMLLEEVLKMLNKMTSY